MYLRGLSTASKGFALTKIEESLKKMKTQQKVALLPTLKPFASPHDMGQYLVPLLASERLGYEEHYTDHSQKANTLWYASTVLGVLLGPTLVKKVSERWTRFNNYYSSTKTNTITVTFFVISTLIGTMTASINSSHHVVWNDQVSNTGFINYDLRKYSSLGQSIAVANENLLEYFNRHPEELEERILSFLKEHAEGDVLLWHDLTKGKFVTWVNGLLRVFLFRRSQSRQTCQWRDGEVPVQSIKPRCLRSSPHLETSFRPYYIDNF